MRPSTGAVLACCVALFALVNRSRGEIGDAVYRDQLEVAGLSVNWHTALTYRYDNGAKTRYVVEADSDIVRVNDSWTAFLGKTGGTFQKQACPANLSLGMRQLAFQYATAQAGTAYWNYYYALAMGYFIGNPLGAYEDPTWITSGMGFRCDGLVSGCMNKSAIIRALTRTYITIMDLPWLTGMHVALTTNRLRFRKQFKLLPVESR